AMMAVVFVRGDGNASETAILAEVGREFVGEAEEYGIAAIPHLHQLGRKRALVSPEAERSLVRQVGMGARRERSCGIDFRVEIGSYARVVSRVDLSAFHGG